MKNMIVRLAVILGTLTGLLITVQPLHASMVAHWTADGSFADSSGNEHHGTGFGDTSFVAGEFGQAFSFDGSGDYVNVAHSSDFNFGTGDFSVTFRVNYNTMTANGNGVIDKDSYNDAPPSTHAGWLFNSYNGGGGIGMETRKAPTVDTGNRYSLSHFTTGTWYNITGTRENNVLNLYVDGILRDTSIEALATNVDNNVDLVIGALRPVDPAAQFFNGMIDDIAIYNHALSQSEVSSIYLDGVSHVPEPATAWLFGIALAGLGFCRNKLKT